jgi:hypothetical protein
MAVRPQENHNIRRIFRAGLLMCQPYQPVLPISALQRLIGNCGKFKLVQSMRQLFISSSVELVLMEKFLLLVQIKSDQPN